MCVIEFVKQQLKGLRDYGVAAAVKHFPGDGVDERDQHLAPSVNSLSVEEYDKTYGAIWQEIVNVGTLSIMVGHISSDPEVSVTMAVFQGMLCCFPCANLFLCFLCV